MSKIAIIAPVHIQPTEEWVAALWDEAKRAGAHVIIVDDSDSKVELPWTHDAAGDVYTYAKQREAMGDELYAMFEQFHHSAACKQFGLWKAYKDGYDVAIIIDSDCVMPEGFVEEHLKALEKKGAGWVNPLAGSDYYSRGFPYSKRELTKWAHMGLWHTCLDLYGADRVKQGNPAQEYPPEGYVEAGGFFPQSGMNISFVREAIPFMLFLPNFRFRDKTFTRHDDIWGGYIFQKIAQEKGGSLSFGLPFVKHDSVVVAEEDAEAEVPMITYEDRFFQFVNDSLIFGRSGCEDMTGHEIFKWLAREFDNSNIFNGLSDACVFWAKALE